MTSKPKKIVVACHYCLIAPGTTDDHIVPRSIIPKSIKLPQWMLILNRVPACLDCNNKKDSYRADCKCRQCLMAWGVYSSRLYLSGQPKVVSLDYITRGTRVGEGDPWAC